jgi:hypothetical protein
MADEPEELRLSLRVSPEVMALVEAHQERLKRLNGSPFTKTQAITSLIEIGSLTWSATEKAAAFSPAALISWASENYGKGAK